MKKQTRRIYIALFFIFGILIIGGVSFIIYKSFPQSAFGTASFPNLYVIPVSFTNEYTLLKVGFISSTDANGVIIPYNGKFIFSGSIGGTPDTSTPGYSINLPRDKILYPLRGDAKFMGQGKATFNIQQIYGDSIVWNTRGAYPVPDNLGSIKKTIDLSINANNCYFVSFTQLQEFTQTNVFCSSLVSTQPIICDIQPDCYIEPPTGYVLVKVFANSGVTCSTIDQDTKCEGQDYYTCDTTNNFHNQGKIEGKCGYTTKIDNNSTNSSIPPNPPIIDYTIYWYIAGIIVMTILIIIIAFLLLKKK